MRADEKVSPFIKVVRGAIVELYSAIGTEHLSREQADLACFDRSAFMLPYLSHSLNKPHIVFGKNVGVNTNL